MTVKITFYGADENCGGHKVEEPTFLVALGDDDRMITLHEACEGDESTLKDLTAYENHSDKIWFILNAEIAAWDKGQKSPLEGGES